MIQKYKRGNFMIVIMFVGLAILAGIGTLQLWLKQAQYTSGIATQNQMLDSAISAKSASVKDIAVARIGNVLYNDLKNNKDDATLSSDFRNGFNSYIFKNYLKDNHISAGQIDLDKITIATNYNFDAAGGKDRFATASIFRQANSIARFKTDTASRFCAINGLKVSGKTVTGENSNTITLNLNYGLFENSSLAWYHRGKAPNLANVSFFDKSTKTGDSPEETTIPTNPLCYFSAPPENNYASTTVSPTAIVRGNYIQNKCYDYTAMDSADGIMYDYLNAVKSTGEPDYTKEEFYSNPKIDGQTIKNYSINPGTSYVNGKARMHRPFEKLNEFCALSVQSIPYKLRTIINRIKVPGITYTTDTEYHDIDAADGIKKYKILVTLSDIPYNADWTEAIDADAVWTAEMESVCIFLGILIDMYDGVPIPEAFQNITVSDILHPNILDKISSYKNDKISSLAAEIKQKWKEGDMVSQLPAWTLLRNFYYTNIPIARNRTPNDYYTLYTHVSGGVSEATDKPLISFIYNSDCQFAYVRFPWLQDFKIYIYLKTPPAGAAYVIHSEDTAANRSNTPIYLGGDIERDNWHICTPAENSSVVANVPICLSGMASSAKTLLASPYRITLAFPAMSNFYINPDAEYKVDGDTPDSATVSTLAVLRADPKWDEQALSAEGIEHTITKDNIAKLTIENRDSPFYISDAQRGEYTITSYISQEADEFPCNVNVCLYDSAAISESQIKKLIPNDVTNVVYVSLDEASDIDNTKDRIKKDTTTGNYASELASPDNMKDKFASDVANSLYYKTLTNACATIFNYNALYSPLKNAGYKDAYISSGLVGDNPKNLIFYVGHCSVDAESENSTPSSVEIGSITRKTNQ